MSPIVELMVMVVNGASNDVFEIDDIVVITESVDKFESETEAFCVVCAVTDTEVLSVAVEFTSTVVERVEVGKDKIVVCWVVGVTKDGVPLEESIDNVAC